jgi:hypothetical protein
MASEINQDLDGARERLRAQAEADLADELPKMVTVQEVADYARCEHKAVRKAIHEGQLQAFDRNRKLVIRVRDAIAWVESRPARVTTPTPSPTPPRAPSSSRKRRSSAPGSVQALREIQRNLTQS